MLLVQPAIGAFASFLAYSIIQRRHVTNNVFPPMEILAAYQRLGDSSVVANIVDTAFSHELPLSELSSFSCWKPLTTSGDSGMATSLRNLNEDKNDDDLRFCTTKAGDFACLINRKTNSSALFGKKPIISYSLVELVSQKSHYMVIEEDMYRRANWNAHIAASEPYTLTSASTTAQGPADSTTTTTNIGGSYRFCYRDYVNHEEVLGMLCRRWSMERLLFRPTLATELLIHPSTKACTLKERGKLFGVVPIGINWDGRLVEGTEEITITNNTLATSAIHWDSSVLKMGWTNLKKLPFLGATIERPPAAEKLRVDPWTIKLSKEDKSGDILCLMRQGKGHLIFGKSECLKQDEGFGSILHWKKFFGARRKKKQQRAVAV